MSEKKKPLDKGEQKVYDYIKNYGSITSMDAFRDLNITRLSARIFDMRAKGYKIKTIRIEKYDEDGRLNGFYAKYVFARKPRK